MRKILFVIIVVAIYNSINCNKMLGESLNFNNSSINDSIVKTKIDSVVSGSKSDSILLNDTAKIQVKQKIDTLKPNIIQPTIKPTAYDTATLDKIVKKSGVFFYVTFVSKNLYEISYKKPGENIIQKISTSDISRIYHRNGKVDVVDNNPEKKAKDWVVKASENEWQRVKVVNDEEKVAGMLEKGEIEAEYTAKKLTNSDNELLEKNAIIVLKKKAFSLKANYVLVKSKNVERNYGEMPSIKMSGIAYFKEVTP